MSLQELITKSKEYEDRQIRFSKAVKRKIRDLLHAISEEEIMNNLEEVPKENWRRYLGNGYSTEVGPILFQITDRHVHFTYCGEENFLDRTFQNETLWSYLREKVGEIED